MPIEFRVYGDYKRRAEKADVRWDYQSWSAPIDSTIFFCAYPPGWKKFMIKSRFDTSSLEELSGLQLGH